LYDTSLTSRYGQEDAGVDLYCPETLVIPPHSQAKIDFGIQCEMTNTQNYDGYYLVPRSSISKTPLRMSNSIGIIDAGYRGNIMAYVDNIYDTPYTIERGQRLFQIVHPSLAPLATEVASSLSTTARGAGGFGSTGK
jgi:dUTP pyrophosphatase